MQKASKVTALIVAAAALLIVGVLAFNYRALKDAYYVRALRALRSDPSLIVEFALEDEASLKRAALDRFLASAAGQAQLVNALVDLVAPVLDRHPTIEDVTFVVFHGNTLGMFYSTTTARITPSYPLKTAQLDSATARAADRLQSLILRVAKAQPNGRKTYRRPCCDECVATVYHKPYRGVTLSWGAKGPCVVEGETSK